MDVFHWDECFITGLPDVDRQHHHLVDVINRFGQALTQQTGATEQDVERVFGELAAYAVYHFREEEDLMARTGVDPRHVRQHQDEHANFLQEVTRMHEDRSVTRSRTFLLRFLTHWLAYHILGSDQVMAAQIAALTSGATPDAAFRAGDWNRDRSTGTLLSALNGLFLQVSERNRDLYALNRSLEARVAERTLALSEANQRLEDMAMTDALTGLPNRRAALRCLEREWDDSRVSSDLTCMMIDADGFKQINDTFGHDAGDEVLRALARCLRDRARTDDTVARLGGDEFLIICPRTPLQGGLQLAETLRQTVAAMVVPAGAGAWRGSISIGVASREPGMESLEALMKAADDGLYLAKRNGRNAVATVCAR